MSSLFWIYRKSSEKATPSFPRWRTVLERSLQRNAAEHVHVEFTEAPEEEADEDEIASKFPRYSGHGILFILSCLAGKPYTIPNFGKPRTIT